MRNLSKYRGIFPAFYACYDDEGNISKERCAILAKFYLEKGVKGLYVEGSSGEALYHCVNERKTVLEAVMEAVGGQLTIIAHIAAASTKDSIDLACHAEKLGVDAIAAIPGIYYSLSEAMVERYWTDILSSIKVDMIIYNIPQTTSFNMSKALFARMLKHPQVIGVKNSSPYVQDILNYKSIGGNNVVIFNGPDEQYLAGRVMGADGGIGGTYGIMPELFLKLENLIQTGYINEATVLQNKISEIITELCSYPSLLAAAKEILKLRGFFTGGARLPMLPLDESHSSSIKLLYNRIMELIEG